MNLWTNIKHYSMEGIYKMTAKEKFEILGYKLETKTSSILIYKHEVDIIETNYIIFDILEMSVMTQTKIARRKGSIVWEEEKEYNIFLQSEIYFTIAQQLEELGEKK